MPTFVYRIWYIPTVADTVGILFLHQNDEYWVVMISHPEYPTLFTTNESSESAESLTSTSETYQL